MKRESATPTSFARNMCKYDIILGPSYCTMLVACLSIKSVSRNPFYRMAIAKGNTYSTVFAKTAVDRTPRPVPKWQKYALDSPRIYAKLYAYRFLNHFPHGLLTRKNSLTLPYLMLASSPSLWLARLIHLSCRSSLWRYGSRMGTLLSGACRPGGKHEKDANSLSPSSSEGYYKYHSLLNT